MGQQRSLLQVAAPIPRPVVETTPDTVPALAAEAARRVPSLVEAEAPVGPIRVGLKGVGREPRVPYVVAAVAAMARLRRGVAVAHAPTAVPETPVPPASQVAPVLKVAALTDLRVMGSSETATRGATDAIGAASPRVPGRRAVPPGPVMPPPRPVAPGRGPTKRPSA